jgi:Protein of unknown function (DUF3667)
MSKRKVRAEKICLNCGEQLQERYCPVCGQENIEPKENILQLVSHLFRDIAHVDGKFFLTLKLLLFRPGFLSKEYLLGRRARYIDPVRMYIFTAFLFFIVLFSFQSSLHRLIVEGDNNNYNSISDSAINKPAIKKEDLPGTVKMKADSSVNVTAKKPVIQDSGIAVPDNIMSLREYDSIQSRLPKEKRDGWLVQRLNKKGILIRQQYLHNREAFEILLIGQYAHSLPTMMFFFLPLVAFVLKLLYVNKWKKINYVGHSIFVIHCYSASYILMLTAFFFSVLYNVLPWWIFGFLSIALVVVIFFYLYKAMRNFYRERRALTIFKFLILNLVVLILFTLSAGVLLVISLYRV